MQECRVSSEATLHSFSTPRERTDGCGLAQALAYRGRTRRQCSRSKTRRGPHRAGRRRRCPHRGRTPAGRSQTHAHFHRPRPAQRSAYCERARVRCPGQRWRRSCRRRTCGSWRVNGGAIGGRHNECCLHSPLTGQTSLRTCSIRQSGPWGVPAVAPWGAGQTARGSHTRPSWNEGGSHRATMHIQEREGEEGLTGGSWKRPWPRSSCQRSRT